MTGIVERLRDLDIGHGRADALLDEAADAIEALTKANAELREALKALNLAYMGVPFQPTAEQLPALKHASEMARAALARKP